MIWSVPRISVGKEEREGHLGRESSLSKGVKRCPSVVQQGDSKLCVMALVVGGHGDKGGVMGQLDSIGRWGRVGFVEASGGPGGGCNEGPV